MTSGKIIHNLLPASILLGLAMGVFVDPASADEVELRWSRDEIRWAEPVTLEITARNPVERPLEGGITISFSSQVLVLDQSPGSQVYFQGSRIMKVGHESTMRSRDVMVETWFRYWLPNFRRTAWVTFFPVRSGLLTVKTRVAWIRSHSMRSVINAPRRSGCIDQQGYPAICRSVFVYESPDALESLREALGERLAWDRPTFENLQRLLLQPTDRRALAHFGIELEASSRRFLEKYTPVLRERFRNPEIRNHPKLLHFLLRLAKNPYDRDVHVFLGFETAELEPEDPKETHISEVESYLSNLQGGTNLLSLIAAEGDMQFGWSQDPGVIFLEYQGHTYSFGRGPDVVVRMIAALIRIKPHSKYIHKKEEVSGYSYLEVLKILRKE